MINRAVNITFLSFFGFVTALRILEDSTVFFALRNKNIEKIEFFICLCSLRQHNKHLRI